MASPNATKPHAAIILSGRRRQVGNLAEKFTDTELEAAENLVLLSESSSGGGMGIVGGSEKGDVTVQQQKGRRRRNDNICRLSPASSSSSMSSVNTRLIGRAMEVHAIDEELTGPCSRMQRYRSIYDVYSITRRIDTIEDQKKKKKRKKRSTKNSNRDMC